MHRILAAMHDSAGDKTMNEVRNILTVITQSHGLIVYVVDRVRC